jgi:hypothetical protein
MKYRVVAFCLSWVGLLAGLTTDVHALPSKCLQAPARIAVCPHLIYKKSALPVMSLDVREGEVICICLSDFKVLNNTAVDNIKKIAQQVSLMRIADKHQLSEQDILTLIKY